MTPSLVEPWDHHNERLVGQVHPPGWTNPVPKQRYHLAVLGAGTGGLVAAAGAAGLGASVALVERHLMGGDCLNVGCVPSKALLAAARAWHRAAGGREFGAPVAREPGDFGAVMERLRRLRADLSPIDGAPRFSGLGVDVFLGEGRFTGPDTMEVAGQGIRFRRAVVATGARAAVPPIPGLAEVGYLTNESVFSLTEPPRQLLVVGGGPIGCELAQAFARFGSEVTVVDVAPRILGRDDQEAAAIVAAALGRDGVRLELGTTVDLVARGPDGIVVSARRGGEAVRLVADRIVVAAGRAPNVDGIGLEQAGVGFDLREGVRTDDRLRTSNPRIYAVGDVCSRLQFTHHADFQARLVLANALFFGRGRASRLIVPWATYTSPELAHVGLTEEMAATRGIPVDVVRVPFREVDRAVLDGETEGLFKAVLARGTDRIVGVSIVASHAGDLIAEGVVAMRHGLGLGAVGQAIHPYPSQAEVYRKAADQWRRGKLTPRVRRLLATWFKYLS
ncbi:MAG: mercuric reductase [Gemmatimonadetes bacterium]|nr:mercuric reductase [Gemmatimonadota bacterium]